MWHIWERTGKLMAFWWGNLKVKGQLEDTGVDGRLMFKEILK
jgi:hypothetical protein